MTDGPARRAASRPISPGSSCTTATTASGSCPTRRRREPVVETADGVSILLGDEDGARRGARAGAGAPGPGRGRRRPGRSTRPCSCTARGWWSRTGSPRPARAGARGPGRVHVRLFLDAEASPPAVTVVLGELEPDRSVLPPVPLRERAWRHAVVAASPRLGRARVEAMEIRNLGNSGLKISAIAYGNWLTHGSQVEEDAALACVRQALDEGITTFDTADVYANTKAESVLGKALKGERREGLEIFTKVYWPTGPGRAQRPRAVAQAHHGVDQRLAAAARHRLRRPLPGAPLRPRDAARGDHGGVRRRRPLRQGALHRRLGVAGRGDPPRPRAGPRAAGSRSSPTSRSTTCSGG